MALITNEQTTKNTNVENNKLCPLRFGLEDQYCLKERCEWYLKGFRQCAMNATPTILFAENRGFKLNLPSETKEREE